MKMTKEQYTFLKLSVVNGLQTDPCLSAVREHKKTSTPMRFRWDLFWAYTDESFRHELLFASKLTDDHIDTALKKLVNEREVQELTN